MFYKKITEKSILTYNGIKIALDELKEKGYNIELSIYDTKYDTTTTKTFYQILYF